MRPKLGRDKILKAAIQLFAKTGFHATSISQIADAAAVSKGLMYNYFESKDTLLLAIIDQASEQMFELAGSMEGSAARGPQPYTVALRQFLDAYGTSLKKNSTQLSFQLSLLYQPDLKALVLGPLQRRGEKLLATTVAMFENAGVQNPSLTARRFVAELDGIALHYLSIFKGYPLDDMLDYVFQNYKDLSR